MKPATKIRAARFFVPVVAAFGTFCAVTGNWEPVITAVWVIVVVLMGVRSAQRQLDGRPPNRWFG